MSSLKNQLEHEKAYDKLVTNLVLVTDGQYKGRIGYCDDIENLKALVFFGDAFQLVWKYIKIPVSFLRKANMNDLLERKDQIYLQLMPNEITGIKNSISNSMRITLMEEYAMLSDQITEKILKKRLAKRRKGKKVFISHSSADKNYAALIASELENTGYAPWLDKWDILAGQSITQRISLGIDECEFVLVLLSKNAIKSHWVEKEWQAKYWDEVKAGKVKVIPLLLQDCKIPILLRDKKYVDFRNRYNDGINELIYSLDKLR